MNPCLCRHQLIPVRDDCYVCVCVCRVVQGDRASDSHNNSGSARKKSSSFSTNLHDVAEDEEGDRRGSGDNDGALVPVAPSAASNNSSGNNSAGNGTAASAGTLPSTALIAKGVSTPDEPRVRSVSEPARYDRSERERRLEMLRFIAGAGDRDRDRAPESPPGNIWTVPPSQPEVSTPAVSTVLHVGNLPLPVGSAAGDGSGTGAEVEVDVLLLWAVGPVEPPSPLPDMESAEFSDGGVVDMECKPDVLDGMVERSVSWRGWEHEGRGGMKGGWSGWIGGCVVVVIPRWAERRRL